MHRLLDVLMLSAAVALAGQSSTVFAQQTSTVDVHSVTLNFERELEYMRSIWLVNAGTVPFQMSMTPPAISCEDLATLVMPTMSSPVSSTTP